MDICMHHAIVLPNSWHGILSNSCRYNANNIVNNASHIKTATFFKTALDLLLCYI